ncbi:28S ribosomal protein s30, mitochondrial, partial [Plakobranchus ocellatus]
CVPRDEGISVTSSPPQLKFKPSVYGHEKALPKKLDSFVAGHRLGDPCEFGLVGMLSTCDTHSVEDRIGSQTARDCRLAMGLTMTFSWLAAQAANQGFSHLIDLTYPLTSQTILTDGCVFSFLAYQLNTLELWKDDEANTMVNLCWHSKEMPLYHSVENGKVCVITI